MCSNITLTDKNNKKLTDIHETLLEKVYYSVNKMDLLKSGKSMWFTKDEYLTYIADKMIKLQNPIELNKIKKELLKSSINLEINSSSVKKVNAYVFYNAVSYKVIQQEFFNSFGNRDVSNHVDVIFDKFTVEANKKMDSLKTNKYKYVGLISAKGIYNNVTYSFKILDNEKERIVQKVNSNAINSRNLSTGMVCTSAKLDTLKKYYKELHEEFVEVVSAKDSEILETLVDQFPEPGIELTKGDYCVLIEKLMWVLQILSFRNKISKRYIDFDYHDVTK